jgi:hypothetical protein
MSDEKKFFADATQGEKQCGYVTPRTYDDGYHCCSLVHGHEGKHESRGGADREWFTYEEWNVVERYIAATEGGRRR